MINIVTRESIHLFDSVQPALLRALTKTDLGKHWNMQALYDHVINFQAYIFVQEASGYAGVIQILPTPLSKVVYFFWSGKDPQNRVPVDYDEVDQFLEHVARDQGCTSIMCEGRRGWKPTLNKRGYFEDSVIFTKEVELNELPIL